MGDVLAKAAEFMKRAHDGVGQTRKDGSPYWTHPLAVFDVLTLELGVRDEDAKAAALLHDVVEDTPVTVEEIAAAFGPAVAGMVRVLSKPKVAGDSPKAKAAMMSGYYAGLRAAAEVVRQIKIADRIHNLRDMHSTPRTFFEKYLPDTRELMGVLEGTAGMDRLRAEYARVEAMYLRRVLEGGFGGGVGGLKG